MKGIILAAALLTTATGTAFAQQQPQFSHYGFNGMYLNPAYAGIKGQAEISSFGRIQYLNYSASFDDGGSPKTIMLTGSMPVRALGGGIGFHVFRDQIAQLKITNAQVSYSKHFKIGEGKLGLGIQGDLSYVGQGVYRAIDANDPSVPSNGSDHKVDVGAGAWYESEKFYAGLSVNNLLRSKYRYDSRDSLGNVIGGGGTAKFLNENHAYLTAGYNIEASSSVVVTPTVLMKIVLPGKFGDSNKFTFKNNSYEAGVRATLDDKYWAGVGYRYDESFTGLVGLSLFKDNAVRLGYAFDVIAFNQDARALSSHEIMISYRFPKPSLTTRPAVHTPRYSF
ncbi:PorP/SprF family type IX secretion system membrane protein [Hymenobacter sp. BT491]|uniref:PorP/SprF family type IX secretion system membrane protein n=1 Tax=Hymenobacter sp. BT491 TaxID=2766779 RepID=UPI0016539952|nr:PorP/SprF family type IX secretion system membrane protein [Hymenobacter sp. BT491]MBC6991473.1 PorP/SprF family type IX secretion system membrane protein [Hymenobacter sp. BT491]